MSSRDCSLAAKSDRDASRTGDALGTATPGDPSPMALAGRHGARRGAFVLPTEHRPGPVGAGSGDPAASSACLILPENTRRNKGN